jgi:hypothetical protein
MADSVTNIPQVSQAQAGHDIVVNALIDAGSPGMIFGRNFETTAALTFGYIGGKAPVAGEPIEVPNDTIALTASSTNYIYCEQNVGSPAGWTVVVTTSMPSGWPGPLSGTQIALYTITTGPATMTDIEDHRVAGLFASIAVGGAVSSVAMTVPTDILAVSGSPVTSSGTLAVTKANQSANVVFAGPTTGSPAAPTMRALVAADLPAIPAVIQIAVTDETTALSTGTAKVTFRMPHAMTLTAVRASLTTDSSSGAPVVDINESGSTILSTKLSIDQGEKTSTTAATPAVISDASLADDAEITIDIDTAGTGAAGLKVSLIGTRSA